MSSNFGNSIEVSALCLKLSRVRPTQRLLYRCGVNVNTFVDAGLRGFEPTRQGRFCVRVSSAMQVYRLGGSDQNGKGTRVVVKLNVIQ